MMPDKTPFAAALRAAPLVVLTMLAAGCTTPPKSSDKPAASAAAPAPGGESEALLAAQAALRDGNCSLASQNYLAAAGFSDDPQVAMRTAQLALGCSQLTIARDATMRWRELSPYSGEAALTQALVAMKLYDVDAARKALEDWRDSGSAGSQDPLSFAEALAEETDASLLYRLFGEVLVSDSPTAEVMLAQARLALAGHNMKEAMSAASRAAEIDAGMIEAHTIVLRAMSVMGEHDAALAGARQIPPQALQGEDAFLLADLLSAAGRNVDAEEALLRLAEDPESAFGANRRLVAMALRQGRLDEAEARLQGLVGERGNAAAAILFFGEISERRGDASRAIQGYGLLADTPLELTARGRAARLMIREGETAAGLELLEEFAAGNPDQALEARLLRAQLQADSGDLKGALAGIDTLAKQYPEHPDVDYTRATVLESGGRTRDALAQFERALKRRPEDPQLLNAFGYTLADHKQRLPDAEEMIRKALAVSPDNPAIQDSLGWVLFRRGKTGEALPVLERAWHNSADAEIGLHFGEVLWKSGDEGQARYVWQQALNGAPDHKGLKATMARYTGEDVDAP